MAAPTVQRSSKTFRATILNVVPGERKRTFFFFTTVLRYPVVTVKIDDADYRKIEGDILTCPPQILSFPWKKEGREPKAGDRIVIDETNVQVK